MRHFGIQKLGDMLIDLMHTPSGRRRHSNGEFSGKRWSPVRDFITTEDTYVPIVTTIVQLTTLMAVWGSLCGG